jgi:hypothetical protein
MWTEVGQGREGEVRGREAQGRGKHGATRCAQRDNAREKRDARARGGDGAGGGGHRDTRMRNLGVEEYLNRTSKKQLLHFDGGKIQIRTYLR